MALDGPKDDDETFDDKGLSFVMNSQLYEKVKPINIDYVMTSMGSGFQISSSLVSGGSCGSACSTGSAGACSTGGSCGCQ